MIYYVALPFMPIEGGLASGQAIECPSGAAAIRRAQALASDKANAGAVAFSAQRRSEPWRIRGCRDPQSLRRCAGRFQDGGNCVMVRRKGELSAAGVDRGWPHQVALRADQVAGANYNIIRDFCRDLSLCAREHSVRRAMSSKPLGMGGVPAIFACAITALTLRQAIVRLHFQMRLIARFGSHCASRSSKT
jgi:hypothetical protein